MMPNCISFARTDHDRLCMGRSPVASAKLSGHTEGVPVWGRVEFYRTPAGLRISATVSGLPRESGHGFCVYRLCVERENGHGLCGVIPPLYEQNGTAWCSVITRKLELGDLVGCRLSVRAWNGKSECNGGLIAEGTLQYP